MLYDYRFKKLNKKLIKSEIKFPIFNENEDIRSILRISFFRTNLDFKWRQ